MWFGRFFQIPFLESAYKKIYMDISDIMLTQVKTYKFDPNDVILR